MTWREKAKYVINQVTQEHPDAAGEELKQLLFDAYPFGGRARYPYRVWREECRKIEGVPTPENIRNFWVDG